MSDNGAFNKKSSDKGLKIVIIGGIAAGTCAAVKARRATEEAEITLYEKYRHVSYSTCGLPYFVSGKIHDAQNLIINPAAHLEKRFNLKVKTLCEVVKIDPAAKTVTVKDLKNGGEYTDSYDKLIIATGSKPVSINPGLESAPNSFCLRTVDEGVNLKEKISALAQSAPAGTKPGAVIVGGGFIGLELLDAFIEKGFAITIIEKTNQILPPFDPEIVLYLENYLAEKGVSVLKEREVAGFEKDSAGNINLIITNLGEKIPADIVFRGIGAKPDSALATGCGIQTGKTGAIVVNEHMQTNIEDIFAAGDCCECTDFITGAKQSYLLAGIASIQGRIAGCNAAGGTDSFSDSIPTAVIKVCDVFVAKTGASLKLARQNGINAAKIEFHGMSHGGYYPGAQMIHMMLVYNRDDGTVIGFEAIGRESVDKKNDAVSVAIRARMKVWDLMFLNFSYHPETGSAKDSLNIIGMIGENIRKGEQVYMDVEELRQRLASGKKVTILDVRTRGEYASGHIDGAVNIPVDDLRENISLLDRKDEIVIHCRTSYRSYIAYRILKNSGFENLYNLNGSYLSWMRKL